MVVVKAVQVIDRGNVTHAAVHIAPVGVGARKRACCGIVRSIARIRHCNHWGCLIGAVFCQWPGQPFDDLVAGAFADWKKIKPNATRVGGSGRMVARHGDLG